MKSLTKLFKMIEDDEWSLHPESLKKQAKKAKEDFDAFMKGEIPPGEKESLSVIIESHPDFKRYDT